jgi:hypothetical protein
VGIRTPDRSLCAYHLHRHWPLGFLSLLPELVPAAKAVHANLPCREDGSRLVAVLGELVQTTAGKWITHSPSTPRSARQLPMPGDLLRKLMSVDSTAA